MPRPQTRQPKTKAGAQVYAKAKALGSMDAVSEATGISRGHLFDLATGLREPSLRDAQALVKIGVRLAWWTVST
jgi:hypothetical protein